MKWFAGAQSVLDPAGPQAGRIHGLFEVFLWVAIIVWVLTVGAMLIAFWKKHGGERHDDTTKRVVTACGVITVAVLLALLVASAVTGSAFATVPSNNVMNIEIRGHQWWWEVHYPDYIPHERVTTANEIHIPVGRPVRFKLTSDDVIHSFWAPNLSGKLDLFPNRVNEAWFEADRPGMWRGQCAEFCGLQHANMAFWVIAEPPDKFNEWIENQRKPGVMPSTPDQAHGQEVFLNGPCVVCHTIRGTNALASVGPDLTHLASRHTIAAGTLALDRGNLAGWVTDAQRIKPGNRMPPVNVPSKDLEPLLAYLESLK
ncbi:MAG TPA: cytochrome c oxidase subunit II [Bryobacteraceae bacterium]|nr:cytochrome c oxidase subunit II [Bryobacteraceae bacterium]